jgi:hypothetical protein
MADIPYQTPRLLDKVVHSSDHSYRSAIEHTRLDTLHLRTPHAILHLDVIGSVDTLLQVMQNCTLLL